MGNRSGGAQSRQPPLQRRSVTQLDALLRSLVPKVALRHAFIKADQLGSPPRHPIQEFTDHIEAAPSAWTRQPSFNEACCIRLDKLPVGALLDAPEQPAPLQRLFRDRHRALRR
jgi:hypothetical protein